MTVAKKEEKKNPLIAIEKVDDRLNHEMGKTVKEGKEKNRKFEKADEKESKSSNKELPQHLNMQQEMSAEHLKGTSDTDIKKPNRNEVPINLKSTENDDALLTFKDLKNSQKSSDDSEDSSEPTDSNDSESTPSHDGGDGGDSK